MSELKKRKRDEELGLPKLAGVNYDAIVDREIVDKRFERERSSGDAKPLSVSSTFDAFQRMAAGLEGRTLADKIANPNRPTWEQYKKENEDKLDLVGSDVRKMVEYRAELDREREKMLQERRKHRIIPEDDSDEEGDDKDSESSRHRKKSKKEKKEKKEKRSKKSKKKHKKESKSKRKASSSDSDSSSDEEEPDK